VSGLQDKKMIVMTKEEKLWKVLCPSRFKRSAPATDKRTGLREPCLWKMCGSSLCDALWKLILNFQQPLTVCFSAMISLCRMGCAALQFGDKFTTTLLLFWGYLPDTEQWN
jgi:hypothetical protein